MRRMLAIWLACVASVGALTSWAQTRDVVDSTGRHISIPLHAQRVVALHEPLIAVPLIELGVPVVGAYGRGDAGNSLMGVDFIASVLGVAATAGTAATAAPVRGIGAVGNVDLEKLRVLRPDLIIGTEMDQRHVASMSSTAPVYLQSSMAGGVRGFAAQAALAQLLGKQAVFDTLRQAYEQRLRGLRSGVPRGAAGGDPTYLAVFIHDRINVVGHASGAVQALEDLGYRRLQFDNKGAQGNSPSAWLAPISSEAFGRLDPDILVVMNTFASPDRSEAAIRADLDRIVPGWSRFLKPAREGRLVYLDSSKVTTPSVASAQHTLDAIEAWQRVKAR